MKDFDFKTEIQGLPVTITIVAKNQTEASNRVYQLVRNAINNQIKDEHGNVVK